MTGKNKHEEKKPTQEAQEPLTKDEHQDHPAGTEESVKEQEEETPDEKLTHLQEELAALNDKYLRLYSEFDNYRKRTLREKIELSKTASAEVITLLLPVIDDLERAILSHSQAGESVAPLTDGITLIYNKFLALMNQQGLEPMKSLGEVFDTDFHEAVTNIPAPKPDLKGKVVDEIQKGYQLNGKVIRFAKVVVGS